MFDIINLDFTSYGVELDTIAGYFGMPWEAIAVIAAVVIVRKLMKRGW